MVKHRIIMAYYKLLSKFYSIMEYFWFLVSVCVSYLLRLVHHLRDRN